MTTAIYTHPACKLHEMGAEHPESPERLTAIEDHLISSRIDGLLLHREAPLALEEELAKVHARKNIRRIKENIPESGYFRVFIWRN